MISRRISNENWKLLCLANLELGLRWLHDKDFYFDYDDNAHINCLELGLRWLHDRAEEDSNAALAEVILEKAPVVLNGLLSALAFDYAQKFAEIPRDAEHARELRKRWKNMKRNKLKKNIP